MGVTQGVKIEQRHIQLFVNDAIRMLQGARLYESAVLASVHKVDWLAAGAKGSYNPTLQTKLYSVFQVLSA